MDISNGTGIGISLFVQGCHFHCKNCFNPETWSFKEGEKWNENIKNKFIESANKSYISRISILGGEPLAKENLEEIYMLLNEIRNKYSNTKKIWLYTGYTLEFINSNTGLHENQLRKSIISMCDMLVDGQYIDELKDMNLKFCGSKNQRIINIKESINKNSIIIYRT